MGTFDAANQRLDANRAAAEEQSLPRPTLTGEKAEALMQELTWRDGYPIEEERTHWLWSDIIMGDAVNLVVAPGNTGKTRLMFELMQALRFGAEQLYGHKLDPGHKGIPCFYGMTTEMSSATAQGLAELTGLCHQGDEGQFVPACCWCSDGSSMIDSIHAFRFFYPNGVLILDSITSLWNPDTADAKEAADTITALKNLGGTVIIIHHENKDKDLKGADKVAGNAAWVHQSDRLIRLKRSPDGLWLDASRRGPDFQTMLHVDWDGPAGQQPDADLGDEVAPSVLNIPVKERLFAWFTDNAEACTHCPSVADAYRKALADGLEVARTSFFKYYGLFDFKAACAGSEQDATLDTSQLPMEDTL